MIVKNIFLRKINKIRLFNVNNFIKVKKVILCIVSINNFYFCDNYKKNKNK